MKKSNSILRLAGIFVLLFSFAIMSAQTTTNTVQTKTKSTQTVTKPQSKTKSSQTGSKSGQPKTTPAKSATKTKAAQTNTKPVEKSSKPEPGTVKIGAQVWAETNLNVSTFRNGDSIPEAKTNKEWVAAGESGKPAWCYYNNLPANGLKYGKLYNWYAVNDTRGLAPEGWTLSNDADWAQLINSLGGPDAAGSKIKSESGWSEGNNGTNESGFKGLPGGYRIENGLFQNINTIGIWWSSTESKTLTAVDHYLGQSGSLSRSSSPKQRGESIRCIRK